MQVFVAFNISEPDVVHEKIVEHYADNYLDAGHESFFIATGGETTRQLASKIGLGDDPVASGIVIPVTSYWGRYNRDIWEWINVKQSANGG